MVITIPENFSANAASLTGDAPEKMELSYETNPGTNYIASKMSETAMKTIEASVRESVTKTYVQAVYDQIGVIGDGMQEAAPEGEEIDVAGLKAIFAKALEELEAIRQASAAPAQPAIETEPWQEDVDFDTFCKSDFRAVKIKNCEAVKKSDKLLKFTLDDGSGTDRIILSGIHQYYEPEQLIGKTAIAILNLPPRKMMGIPSCGMLISAVHKEKGEEKLHLMLIDDSVPAGAKLC